MPRRGRRESKTAGRRNRLEKRPEIRARRCGRQSGRRPQLDQDTIGLRHDSSLRTNSFAFDPVCDQLWRTSHRQRRHDDEPDEDE
jgi:hypothetical protein